MNMNLENPLSSNDLETNEIQVELAEKLFTGGNMTIDEKLQKWVSEGYTRRFGDYIASNPGEIAKIINDGDDEALDRLEKIILH